MKFKEISSYEELINNIKDIEKSYVLLFKSGSSTSDCAINNLSQVENDDLHVFTADVATVRNIHQKYGIKTVPTLMSFEKDNFQNVVKGCNNPDFYRSFFENTANVYDESGPRQPIVTVYSTPSCSWCTTLKSHLRKHKIRFTDIDVSRDQLMAEELVRKSGQQGVPQTEIDGEMIVGFDKSKINKLLNIN